MTGFTNYDSLGARAIIARARASLISTSGFRHFVNRRHNRIPYAHVPPSPPRRPEMPYVAAISFREWRLCLWDLNIGLAQSPFPLTDLLLVCALDGLPRIEERPPGSRTDLRIASSSFIAAPVDQDPQTSRLTLGSRAVGRMACRETGRTQAIELPTRLRSSA